MIQIGNNKIKGAFLGKDELKYIYIGKTCVYYKETTGGDKKPVYVIYDDVSNVSRNDYNVNYAYDKKTSSWYVWNDQNEWEKYGVIDTVNSLDNYSETKYYDVDLNNEWQTSTFWSKDGYSCYESFSNHGVANGAAWMKITILTGETSAEIIFGSDAESNYDYSCLMALDVNKPTSVPTYNSNNVVATSRGNQNKQITYTYTITDTTKEHFFWVCYRKDGSQNVGNDRGYLLIKENTALGAKKYLNKIVNLNGTYYLYNGTEWLKTTNTTYPSMNYATGVTSGTTAERDNITDLGVNMAFYDTDDKKQYFFSATTKGFEWVPDPANGHEYVEIAGIKWATMNVGASSSADTGLYFQWGDTQGYSADQVTGATKEKSFTINDYKWYDKNTSAITKYCSSDKKTTLDIEDDPVHAAWGGAWRLPTKEELTKLTNYKYANNSWHFETSDDIGFGALFTDTKDETKSIFLSGHGYKLYNGKFVYDRDVCLWSNTLWDASSSAEEKSWSTAFYRQQKQYSSTVHYDIDLCYRYYGLPVRGVLDA